jgi:hypothetical protein
LDPIKGGFPVPIEAIRLIGGWSRGSKRQSPKRKEVPFEPLNLPSF